MSVLDNVALGAHLRGAAGVVARRAAARPRRGGADARRGGAGDRARRPRRAQLHRAGRQPAARASSASSRSRARSPPIRCCCCSTSPRPACAILEKQELAALLRQLRAEGMTVLLVEHDMDFVMGLDRPPGGDGLRREARRRRCRPRSSANPRGARSLPGRRGRRVRPAALAHDRAARGPAPARRLRQGRGRARRLADGAAGHDRHRDRPQRRRQDDAARRDHGAAAGARRRRATWARRPAIAVGRAARGARPDPRARAARAVRRDERRRQPASSARSSARAAGDRGWQATLAEVYQRFPRLAGAPRPARRHAVRRRAADAGDGPRADGQADAADARRAIARTRAADRARDLPASSPTCARPACRSCWSSRTRAPRCRSPTTATCWRPASWRSKARAPNSPPIRASRRPTWAKARRRRTRRMSAARESALADDGAAPSTTRPCIGRRGPGRAPAPKDFRDRSFPSRRRRRAARRSAPPAARPRRARRRAPRARARRRSTRTTSISPTSTSSTRASRAGASRKASSSPGAFSIDRGVGIRAVHGEKQAFAYSDDITLAGARRGGGGDARHRPAGAVGVRGARPHRRRARRSTRRRIR